MALFVKMFCGGEKVRKKKGQEDESEKLQDAEELLLKKKDFLKRKIDQELLCAKENSRKNRRVALQALRKMKRYEKNVKHIDCAVKAMKSAHEYMDIHSKVNDLIKNITEEHEGAREVSDTLYTSASVGVEFDENELQAELERLVRNQDESIFDNDIMEEQLPSPRVSSTASPSQPGKNHLVQTMSEEEEIEDALDHLRRWANEPL
ncbi:charged multivesicular body protein 4b-like [Scomber scombrus]|uniref:Charged multivesicular body protein 4b-like n=1 Tax=Scomber scombrus TaxID=13677 RepID=A0AAV1PT01_SCOSC